MKNLTLAWAYQSPNSGSWQSTPLVVDGIMYLTQRPNDVMALDAVTGRVYWMYRYNNASEIGVCCGANNRGLAILGDTLFMGTLDATLVAIDAKDGTPIWKTKVADSKIGLLAHRRAARDQGSGRLSGWVVASSAFEAFDRRVRCQDRQGALALQHDSGPWRAGPRNVGSVPAESGRRIAIPWHGRTAADRCGSPARTIPR